MTRTTDTTGRPEPLALNELFSRYLSRQATAGALGLGPAESRGEVEPFDAVPVQPVDAQLAWADATAVLKHFRSAPATYPVPPEWPALVAAQEPAIAVPFCIGNFPQLVRDLHQLFTGTPTAVPRSTSRPIAATELIAWAKRQHGYPTLLLAAGALRLARHFDAAEELLVHVTLPRDWQAAQANEEAALAWQRGHGEESLELWSHQRSLPATFNRGMALLFLGKPNDAREPLAQAVAELPETGAWHHLGKLYLALAERGQAS